MSIVRSPLVWLAAGLLLSTGLVCAEPPQAELLKLHAGEAEAYRIYTDKEHQHPLELSTKPVFNWTNVVGEHTQYGHLFVWTRAGRPEAIGTIFSTQAAQPDKRILIHEFHTLSTDRLYPVTPQTSRAQWTPEAGIVLSACEGAPAVARTEAQRLVQMRAIARTFAAETRSREQQTWELRLLPTPLVQYQPTAGDVVDGALFAMVSSAGTDPELLLLIEARRDAKGETAWSAAALRFSDKDIVVRKDDKPLWSSLDDDARRAEIKNNYTLIETRDKTYMCYRSRIIDELPAAP